MKHSIQDYTPGKGVKPALYITMFALLLTSGAWAAAQDNLVLFSADSGMRSGEWRIVNDGVMGGRSKSALSESPNGTLVFAGNVSLENNGGFASVRGPQIPEAIGQYKGIELTVVGDGNIYKCGIRTKRGFDGVAHQASFKTVAGVETLIRIPFADFKPTWRGRTLPDSQRMNPSDIRSIGFMISDKQEGPFQLEVRSIAAYGAQDAESEMDMLSIAEQAGTFKTLLAAIQAAGLTEAVRSLDGATLFAPTDEAFAKLPEGTVATLLEPQNKDQLVNILTYHVIDQEVGFSTATSLDSATALNGEQIEISVKKGALLLNESRVIENDIQTENGLIHVIDSVLLPPELVKAEQTAKERIILSAIRRGVPLFNNGNAQACTDLYELAAEALLLLPEENLCDQQRAIFTKALAHSRSQQNPSDRAWTMRIALDRILDHSDG